MSRGLKAHYPFVGKDLQVQTDEIADRAVTLAKIDPAVLAGIPTEIPTEIAGVASLDVNGEVVEPARNLSQLAPVVDGDVQVDTDTDTLVYRSNAANYSLRPQTFAGLYGPIEAGAPDTDNEAIALNMEKDLPIGVPITVNGVLLRVGTPPALGDSFKFNIVKNDGFVAVDLFTTDQSYPQPGFGAKVCTTADAGATYTNVSVEVEASGDAQTAAIGGLDTVANGDWVVFGMDYPFSGISVVMDGANVNAQAAALTVEYWNGSAWTAVPGAITDGTNNAGATFGKTGAISFKVPGDWVRNEIDGTAVFYVRLGVSAALTAGTAIDAMVAIPIDGHPAGYEMDTDATARAIDCGDSLHLVVRDADATADDITVSLIVA